jgi:LemA protein
MKRINFWSTVSVIALTCVIIIAISTKHCDVCFSAPAMALKIIACGFATILFTVYYCRKFKEQENLAFGIESEPMQKTNEATDGVPFAGEGTIESENDNLLVSPYTNTKCVYFHSILEQYVKQGKSSSWRVIDNNVRFVPFHLKDEKGTIDINLANMDDDFSGQWINNREFGVPDPKNSEIDCFRALAPKEFTKEKSPHFLGLPLYKADEKYRKSEFILTPGTRVFVYGIVAKNPDGDLAIRENQQCPLIISTKDRDRYVEDFYKGSSLIYFSCLLIAIGFTLIIYAADFFLKLSGLLFSILLAAGNAIILGSAAFAVYNRMIALKFRALNAQSNIEVELKRRADLIPNLATAVKAYSAHELEIQEFTAQARAQMTFSKNRQAEAGAKIPALSAIIENYPALRAAENFRSLMEGLRETEGRIAYSREFYNRTVRKYNLLIGQFPFVLIARLMSFKPMDYLSISRG